MGYVVPPLIAWRPHPPVWGTPPHFPALPVIDTVFGIQGSSCLLPTPSGLSLLYFPGLPPSASAGSPDTCASVLPYRHWPSGNRDKPLATPKTRSNQLHAGTAFDDWFVRFRYGPPVRSPHRADQTSRAQRPLGLPRLLLPGFQVPGSPRAPAGYHYGAKLRIAPAGLSPASTAASLAAPPPSVPPQAPSSGRPLPIRRVPWGEFPDLFGTLSRLRLLAPRRASLRLLRSALPPLRSPSLPRSTATLRGPGPFLSRRPRRLSTVEKTRYPRFLDDPCVHAPLSDPGGPPPPRPLQGRRWCLPRSRPRRLRHAPISGLHHAACTPSVYASQPGSPPDYATLDSGWWPALAGQDSHLLGRIDGLPSCLSVYMASSGRALARAPVGGGFPAPPFRLRGGFTVPP